MPVIISDPSTLEEIVPATGEQSEHADAAQITVDLVNQVADRVMALLLQDLKYERERRRSVGRSDRLKGVR